MKMINSYLVKCHYSHNRNIILNDTLKIYRQLISQLISIYEKEWAYLSSFSGNEQFNKAEHLVHSTKHNHAKYTSIDINFHKFPSMLRRSAISDSLGIVSSYFSNLDNYNKEKENYLNKGEAFTKQPPKLSTKHFKCPALYKKDSYKWLFTKEHNNLIQLKVYKNNNWVWVTVPLRQQDINYIHQVDGKQLSPILRKKGRQFYLQFGYETNSKLNNTPLVEQKVLAIDLGLNHTVVGCILTNDGTIQDRLFISHTREQDQITHLVNKIRRNQKKGNKKNLSLWNKINNTNLHIVNDTVSKLISFAKKHQAAVIVMEHLNFDPLGKSHMGKSGYKSMNKRLHLWKHRMLQKKLKHKTHGLGIRYSQVNPKNTSALAYDGSGKVKRNSKNYSLCTFQNGKQYHSDLNACYNIGARYFIRKYKEIHLNSKFLQRRWSEVVAKVPKLLWRTQCTLSTLRSLHEQLLLY